MAYAVDLKSTALKGACGFDPHPGHDLHSVKRLGPAGGARIRYGMGTAIMLLAAAGVIAVMLRLLRALFATLRGGVDAFIAHDVAETRGQRGDLTGVDDARAAAALARRRRLLALGAACMWIGLLVAPVLTPWPASLYAAYSLLWLIPRTPRHAPRA